MQFKINSLDGSGFFYQLTRDVTPQECSWLKRTYYKGERVQAFIGFTYGCIGPNGIACSDNGDNPFYELPKDSINKIKL